MTDEQVKESVLSLIKGEGIEIHKAGLLVRRYVKDYKGIELTIEPISLIHIFGEDKVFTSIVNYYSAKFGLTKVTKDGKLVNAFFNN